MESWDFIMLVGRKEYFRIVFCLPTKFTKNRFIKRIPYSIIFAGIEIILATNLNKIGESGKKDTYAKILR